MGKTYEAMERAEKEYEEKGLGLPRITKQGAVYVYPRRADHHAAMECYEELKTNLLAGHTQESKTLLILGTNHRDGSSTTAINFASTLAGNCRMRVLLIDANLRTPSLHETFGLEQEHGLSDLLTNGRTTDALVKKVDERNLHVVTCGSNRTAPVTLFESKRFCEFLKLMRNKFDYVILDGPPAPSFSETRVLCSKVDGVIMVLAAGKTREQVAKRAKQEIEGAGGKILGVVLNRRRFRIPEWIYRWL
jgi:protein-tyrosine kinase